MINYHKKLINKYKLEKLASTEDFNLSNIIIEFHCQIINLKHIENENQKYDSIALFYYFHHWQIT